MKTIDNITVYQEEIKKSKFITILHPLHSKNDLKDILTEVKKKYPKATHYCYSYRLLEEEGMSDDKEPSKTAGAPMLNVLKSEDIIFTVAIVVRYFKGIKLGYGGLIRAYTNGVKKALEIAQPKGVIKGYTVLISIPYSKEKELAPFLANNTIVKKSYQEDCQYLLEMDSDTLNKIKNIATIIEINTSYITKK